MTKLSRKGMLGKLGCERSVRYKFNNVDMWLLRILYSTLVT